MIRRFIRSLLRRRPVPVIVQTYRVQRTDLAQLRDLKHAELARELGRPLRGDRLNG